MLAGGDWDAGPHRQRRGGDEPESGGRHPIGLSRDARSLGGGGGGGARRPVGPDAGGRDRRARPAARGAPDGHGATAGGVGSGNGTPGHPAARRAAPFGRRPFVFSGSAVRAWTLPVCSSPTAADPPPAGSTSVVVALVVEVGGAQPVAVVEPQPAHLASAPDVDHLDDPRAVTAELALVEGVVPVVTVRIVVAIDHHRVVVGVAVVHDDRIAIGRDRGAEQEAADQARDGRPGAARAFTDDDAVTREAAVDALESPAAVAGGRRRGE